MARIAEELKAKAIGLGIEGPYTSWRHMFGWNTFGLLLLGPAVATKRFFDTLNKVERKLNANESAPPYFSVLWPHRPFDPFDFSTLSTFRPFRPSFPGKRLENNN